MELAIHNDGTWSLGKLHALERLLLERVIDAANPKDCSTAQERLFPHILGHPPVTDEEEKQDEEWKEYVQPDLQQHFNSALDVVAADLKTITKKRSKHGDLFSLTVPKKHADQWCSALNQARLVLHERFKLPDGESPDRFLESEDEEPDAEGKWMAMLQSEIYSHIMEFLVTRVLWLK